MATKGKSEQKTSPDKERIILKKSRRSPDTDYMIRNIDVKFVRILVTIGTKILKGKAVDYEFSYHEIQNSKDASLMAEGIGLKGSDGKIEERFAFYSSHSFIVLPKDIEDTHCVFRTSPHDVKREIERRLNKKISPKQREFIKNN
jgi:hypothetical protein